MAHGPYINRAPPYTDLNLDFFPDSTNDVSILTGEEAVKRSVRNLVMTNHWDRPFQSYIGGNVRKLLFDNPSDITGLLLRDAIRDVIVNWEPRVQLQSVVVQADNDSNGYNVTIRYIVLNRMLPLVQDLFLERIR